MMVAVGIALGSNLGNSKELIEQAIQLLSELSLSPIKKAAIYRTAPVDCPPGSPDFLNTAVEITCDKSQSAKELLKATQAIEVQLGREVKQIINEPRPIDIDILYMGNLITTDGDPVIPHPRMLERTFVLKPLNDIAADLILPHTNLSVAEHLKNLEHLENLQNHSSHA